MIQTISVFVGTSNGSIVYYNIDTNSYQQSQVWSGNKGGVNCLKMLSANVIVSGGADNTLVVWNVTTLPGIAIANFTQHNASVNCVEKLLNGSVVSGGSDCNLFIWDPLNGRTLLIKINAHSAKILCLKLLPDGRFASGAASEDNTIKIWNPNTFALVFTLIGHSSDVLTLELLSVGFLVSGSDDKYAMVWNVTTGNLTFKFIPVNSNSVSCIKELPTKATAYSGDNSALYFWLPYIMFPTILPNIMGNYVPCKAMMVYNRTLLIVSSNGPTVFFINVASLFGYSLIKKVNISTSFILSLENPGDS